MKETDVRKEFEKELDAVISRSDSKDVFSFLKEQQEKRIITLYAGTYSFDYAMEICKGDTNATFYFYLNGYKYGYVLNYFQGRFKLERDENIFSKEYKRKYTKKALFNRKADMRSGEYFESKKELIKSELFDGLFGIIFYLVCFAIGACVLALTGLSDCDTDGELSVAIGIIVLVVIIIAIIGICKLIEKLRKK